MNVHEEDMTFLPFLLTPDINIIFMIWSGKKQNVIVIWRFSTNMSIFITVGPHDQKLSTYEKMQVRGQ